MLTMRQGPKLKIKIKESSVGDSPGFGLNKTKKNGQWKWVQMLNVKGSAQYTDLKLKENQKAMWRVCINNNWQKELETMFLYLMTAGIKILDWADMSRVLLVEHGCLQLYCY